jgi:N-acetylneuraminic acid mutarotase
VESLQAAVWRPKPCNEERDLSGCRPKNTQQRPGNRQREVRLPYMWRAPAFVLWLLPCVQLVAQAWTQRADVGYHSVNSLDAQWYGATFVLGTHAYVVAGEYFNSTTTDATWRYDPLTEQWESRAAFPGTARIGASAFVLNGKGYVFGGSPGPGNELWEYDGALDTWIQRADLPSTGRADAVAFVADGRAHICTGSGMSLLQDHWVYDSVTDEWMELAPLPGPARKHALSFVVDDRAYVGTGNVGGWQGVNDLWEYDVLADSWIARTPPGDVARWGAYAFVLDGNAYVGSGVFMNDPLWKYDQIADSWVGLPSNNQGQRRASTFVIGMDAFVLLGEVHTTIGGRIHSAWRFNNGTLQWSKIRGMGGVPRSGSVAFTLHDGGHVCTGAVGHVSLLDAHTDHWVYDLAEQKWSPKRSSGALARSGAVAFAGETTGYVLTGMYPDFGEGQNTGGRMYDLATDSWQEMPLPASLYRSAAVAFWINGKGYLALGAEDQIWQPQYLTDLWEFDPPSGTWSQKASLPSAGRVGARAFVLHGKAYVVGGDTLVGAGGTTNDVWVYDPFDDAWQQRASIPGPNLGTSIVATHIGDHGYVCGESHLWEYDPYDDTWQPGTPPPVPFNAASFAFSVGDKGFFGGGHGAIGKIFYEYSPADDDLIVHVPQTGVEQLKIWPNPVRDGMLHVRFPNLTGAHVDVLDVAGRRVHSRSISRSSDGLHLQLPNAAPGVYTVRVRTAGAMVTGRIVVEE